MFRKIQKMLKPSYNSVIDDVAEKFYIPVLSESINYQRVSGYFSCKALSIYAEGLEKIAKNNGYVQFIISQNISEKDAEEITRGYLERSKGEVLTNRDKQRLGNLAYLIAQGKVDVKFGIVDSGLFHTKWGLFEDQNQDIIYFNGSLNETANAMENNFDSFDVDFSWDISTNVRDRVRHKQEEFKCLWENKYPGVQVIPASELVYPLIKKFDNGRIQETPQSDDNSVVFAMNDKNFYFIDNTDERITLKKTFKNKFNFYVDEEKGYPYFRHDLTYKEIESIIKLAEKQTNKFIFDFIVSSQVEMFINSQKYSIDEYHKAGLTLKNEDIRWTKEFKEFKEVVSLEVYRELKPVQLQSSMYMLTQKRAANFSVPGAGKTAMMLGVFSYLSSKRKNEIIKRLLVISPINAFKSWEEEFEKVFGFGSKKKLKLLTVHDENVNGDILAFESLWSQANLILVNYESLPKFKSSIIKCLNLDSGTMLVFDEVHRIKGIHSQRASAALEVAEKVDYRYVLTGTPIPNGYLDIYNFLNILFKKEYNSHFGFDKKMLKNPDSWQVEEINEKLAPYFWRTGKEELGVPNAEPNVIVTVQPSKKQIELSKIIYRTAKNPLGVLIRMIQLSTNPELIDKVINYNDLGYSEYDTEDISYNQVSDKLKKEIEISMNESIVGDIHEWDLSRVESPKFNAGIDLVVKLVQKYGKVVVWGLFVDTLQKINNTLEERGIKSKVIYGGTPKNERESTIEIFKKSTDEIQVLISNPNTLGESVSLHTVAHDAVYFEYNYNLTFMLQSRDRIHRLGLTSDQQTRYYYLMTVSEQKMYNFIDKKIYDRLLEKEKIMKDAIEGNILIPEFPDDEVEEMKRIIESERSF